MSKSKAVEKVDSTVALRYVWFCWKLLGVYPNADYSRNQIMHLAFIIGFANILSLITFIVKLFFMSSFKNLLDNLPMNIVAHLCLLKFIMILVMRRKLIGINDYLRVLDNRPMTEIQRGFLLRMLAVTRILTILIMICYEGVDLFAAVSAAFSHRQRLGFEIWLPYDFKASAFRYWITLIVQYIAQSTLAVQSFTNDFSAPTYLLVLTSHLEVLIDRIKNLSSSKRTSPSESRKQLIQCIQDHRNILSIYEILQETVSYTIFIQFFGTALIICVLLLNYLLYPPSIFEMIAIGFFLIAAVLQVFPSCYYSHELMVTSDRLVTALFSSNWMDQSIGFKKCIVIFMQMTQRPKVIVAGRIIPVTLSTFVSLMRVSYSLFTLANRIRK